MVSFKDIRRTAVAEAEEAKKSRIVQTTKEQMLKEEEQARQSYERWKLETKKRERAENEGTRWSTPLTAYETWKNRTDWTIQQLNEIEARLRNMACRYGDFYKTEGFRLYPLNTTLKEAFLEAFWKRPVLGEVFVHEFSPEEYKGTSCYYPSRSHRVLSLRKRQKDGKTVYVSDILGRDGYFDPDTKLPDILMEAFPMMIVSERIRNMKSYIFGEMKDFAVIGERLKKSPPKRYFFQCEYPQYRPQEIDYPEDAYTTLFFTGSGRRKIHVTNPHYRHALERSLYDFTLLLDIVPRRLPEPKWTDIEGFYDSFRPKPSGGGQRCW